MCGIWGGGEYVGQSILGQLKSPKRRQSGRCVMSFVRVHKRVVVSVVSINLILQIKSGFKSRMRLRNKKKLILNSTVEGDSPGK